MSTNLAFAGLTQFPDETKYWMFGLAGNGPGDAVALPAASNVNPA
jgi:hypothetical protein